VQRCYPRRVSGGLDALKSAATRIQLEIFGEGKLGLVSELYAAELAPKVEQLVTDVRAAFPDLAIRIDYLLAEDNRVACRWRAMGTHGGWFLSVPATGARIRWTGVSIYTFGDDGKVVDMAGNWDVYGIVTQLRQALAGD
jgi:SnoaL-like polyketide cyclase